MPKPFKNGRRKLTIEEDEELLRKSPMLEERIALLRKRFGGVSVEWFIHHVMQMNEFVGGLYDERRSLPDAIRIRYVKDLEAVPQARCNFGQHGGATTTVTRTPVDYRKGRQCK